MYQLFSPEEKLAYFSGIRKNDPKRLCEQRTKSGEICNGRAVVWEPLQACKYHRPDALISVPKNSNQERPKIVIDSLVLLLDEAVWKLNPQEEGDLIKRILGRIKEVRPLGLPEKEEITPVSKELSREEKELRRMKLLASKAPTKKKQALYWAAYKKLAKKLGVEDEIPRSKD